MPARVWGSADGVATHCRSVPAACNCYNGGIAARDESLREYYLKRTGGKRVRSWTADMSGLLGKESRPHIKDFLANRGFTMR